MKYKLPLISFAALVLFYIFGIPMILAQLEAELKGPGLPTVQQEQSNLSQVSAVETTATDEAQTSEQTAEPSDTAQEQGAEAETIAVVSARDQALGVTPQGRTGRKRFF